MLCPQCKIATPGGAICPLCGNQVPERETFGGQGSHYLWVLAVMSVLLLALLFVLAALRVGLAQAWPILVGSRWVWFYALLCLAPLGVGAYYWFLLRDEETVVTDAYIERRSHWGTQRLLWSQATGFNRQLLPFQQTRLGRISGLSRVLSDSKLIAKLPPYAYEIIATAGQEGERLTLIIEPGTVDDLPWLLSLVGERLGPPEIT